MKVIPHCPVIRKQQVLKALKTKWKRKKDTGAVVMPWFLLRDMIRNGWFFVKRIDRC